MVKMFALSWATGMLCTSSRNDEIEFRRRVYGKTDRGEIVLIPAGMLVESNVNAVLDVPCYSVGIHSSGCCSEQADV